MTEKSDPSIYDDRTTIGSSDELDEYGVWVKSDNQGNSDSLPDLDTPLSDDLELPDFDDIQDGFLPDIGDNSDLDSDSGLDLPEFDDDLDLSKIDSSSDPEASLGETELDLENFNEISNFDDMSTDSESDLPDLPDFDGFGAENTIDGLEESNKLEFEEVSDDNELPEGQAPIAIDKDGFTEISLDEFLGSVVIEEVDELPGGGIDIGNLDSSIQDFDSAEQDEEIIRYSEGRSGSAVNADLSTVLLQKIADELSSIKKEISSLKTELATVRGSGQQKGTDSSDNTGFFDEEDDEKISLTGDELDNILHTANFTEESGTDVGIDSGFPASEDSSAIAFEDDIGELNGAIPIEDEVKSLGNDDFDISLDLTPGAESGSTEVDQLWEDGISPITEAPEDISYLEEDPLAFEDETINTDIDFSESTIDEPDLSADITENPVLEPAINDISIDLEMDDVSFGSPSIPGASDDFVFESEETMEIQGEIPELIPGEIPAGQDLADTFEDVSMSDFEDSNFEDSIIEEIEDSDDIPSNLKQELKTILSYMDQLLESLPEEKIEEFAKSEYFDTYKKLFEELGLA